MEIIGIICEYNPLHLGHRKQIAQIRQTAGPDCGIVCLMSGNYVQRGAPAIVDKMRRAEAFPLRRALPPAAWGFSPVFVTLSASARRLPTALP